MRLHRWCCINIKEQKSVKEQEVLQKQVKDIPPQDINTEDTSSSNKEFLKRYSLQSSTSLNESYNIVPQHHNIMYGSRPDIYYQNQDFLATQKRQSTPPVQNNYYDDEITLTQYNQQTQSLCSDLTGTYQIEQIDTQNAICGTPFEGEPYSQSNRLTPAADERKYNKTNNSTIDTQILMNALYNGQSQKQIDLQQRADSGAYSQYSHKSFFQ